MIFLHKKGISLLSLIICGTLLCPTNAKADACEDTVTAVNKQVNTNADRLKRYSDQVTIDSLVSGEASCQLVRLSIQNWIDLLPIKRRSEQACGSRLTTKCNSACTEKNLAESRAEAEKVCASSAIKKPTQASNCVTPPTPKTVRHSSTRACFIATNTNSDEKCIYSFTFTVTGFGSMGGGNVQPGKSEERCIARAGVEIEFEKWTLSHSGAR